MASIKPGQLTSFTKNEVNNIFKTAKSRIKTEWFDIILAKKDKDFGRVLIITSRKIGNAPKRNRLRRRIKSIFYEEKLYIQPFDCIIISKSGAAELQFWQLKEILLEKLKN